MSTDKYILHNIIIFEFLQKTDFANGSTRYTLIFCLKAYFFESNNLICAGVAGFVDHAVCAW